MNTENEEIIKDAKMHIANALTEIGLDGEMAYYFIKQLDRQIDNYDFITNSNPLQVKMTLDSGHVLFLHYRWNTITLGIGTDYFNATENVIACINKEGIYKNKKESERELFNVIQEIIMISVCVVF